MDDSQVSQVVRMPKAIMSEKDEAGYRASVKGVDDFQLPPGDVTVRVSHSTLNDKDGLAITGRGPVVRKFRRFGRYGGRTQPLIVQGR